MSAANAKPTILDCAALIHGVTRKDPLTPRWEATLRAFYGLELRDQDLANLGGCTRRTEAGLRSMANELAAGQRRFTELWCRVGRRGRKSFTAALVALYESAFGGHERYLVPGERGLIAIISKDTAGSNLVANFCELHGAALGFETKWTTIGNVRVLELSGVPFGIACFPCNAKAPRGYAIPVIIADEIAHWATDSDEYVNSDDAVLGAVKPAMAQFPDSKLVAISSPLGRDGLHYDALEKNLGDDAEPGVLAVEGPTWLWNPEITEARTHEIEKDPETQAREFGARCSENESTAFVQSDVDHCFEGEHPGFYAWGRPIAALDLSQWTNTLTIIVGQWGEPDRTAKHYRRLVPPPESGLLPSTFVGYELDGNGEPVLIPPPERPLFRVFAIDGWDAQALRTTPMNTIIADIANIVKSSGADTVLADSYGARFAAALLSYHQVKLRAFEPSNASINEAVGLLRMLMRDKQIAITKHDRMLRDLRTYPRTISGGTFKYGKARRGKHHWDYASALVTMAHGFLEERGSSVTKTHFMIDGLPTIQPLGGRFVADPR